MENRQNIAASDTDSSGKKRRRKFPLWGKVLIVLAVLVLAADIFVSNYLVTYAIARSGDGGDRGDAALEVAGPSTDSASAMDANRQIQDALTAAFLADVQEQEVSIVSSDGLTLVGGLFEHQQPASHLWALVIHGNRGSHENMYDQSERFYDAGYNVLAPDMRACGGSEGDYVGMGWTDRLDVLQWMDWIIERDPQAQIVMYGASMGGATTMMTAGEDTPEQVVAFVEDCGYTSVWDIFSSELSLRFGLPDFPVLYTADLISSLRAGYSFSEASSVDQLANCEKPMLFIHGEQDDFVPYWMLQEVYDAKPGDNKQMISVPDAGHDESRTLLGDEYWTIVFDFLNQYVTPAV